MSICRRSSRSQRGSILPERVRCHRTYLRPAPGGTRPVSTAWANDSVAKIRPSASADSNTMVFMMCLLLPNSQQWQSRAEEYRSCMSCLTHSPIGLGGYSASSCSQRRAHQRLLCRRSPSAAMAEPPRRFPSPWRADKIPAGTSSGTPAGRRSRTFIRERTRTRCGRRRC
jgi:hypothetical protein